MKNKNFLLGRGERLTEPIIIRSGPVTKISPYTFAEAKERLQPMLTTLAEKMESQPNMVCPEGNAVAVLTLNPEYVAKSYYPSTLLRTVGLEAIGSRKRNLIPDKLSKERTPIQTTTTELFVKGQRRDFLRWAQEFEQWQDDSSVSEIVSIEQVEYFEPESKISYFEDSGDKQLFEVVLQGSDDLSEVLFMRYLNQIGLDPSFDRKFYVEGLRFFEIESPAELVDKIAKFSLVRVIRKMPELRLMRPIIRSTGIPKEAVRYPVLEPINKEVKVAIFDGGIPTGHPLCQWATPYDFTDLGQASTQFYEHGVSVTSAFLFGHIDPKVELPQPYSFVDHYRVFDELSGGNPYELYDVLDRIDHVLSEGRYEFINLSIGPTLPIEDNEVHAWTAVLDNHLSKGNVLATFAVGNDGEGDPTINANRIQVPSDCVNGLAIGACDVPDNNWERASYSSVGPGRSPGLLKPDLVDFGGSTSRPFVAVGGDGDAYIQTSGTSFAAPAALRIGAGIKAHFGSDLNALAIKALLIHTCESAELPKSEVGWGRIARDLNSIVMCDDHVMRVVFQGKIKASKYLRTPIPLPLETLEGKVNIKATLCYATVTDPHHPNNYTRSGLEVVFRPNKLKRVKTKPGENAPLHAASKRFFGSIRNSFLGENELRKDAFKWENCLQAEQNFYGTSLVEPVFDIHFNARRESHNDISNQEIAYALIITVTSPRTPDLYNRVASRYATHLQQIKPLIDIPLKLSLE